MKALKIIAVAAGLLSIAGLAYSQWGMTGNSCMVVALASLCTWVRIKQNVLSGEEGGMAKTGKAREL